MSTDEQLRAFIARQLALLKTEFDAELERTSLLLSKCGPKVLEQKGLALGGLGVAAINVGLGGKTLVELERPAAYHSSPNFPPHTFRPGDLARIEENSTDSSKKKKKANADEERSSRSAEGVVYKVTDTRIVVAVDQSDSGREEVDLPDRCRVVKLANSVTFDRMEKAIRTLEKVVLPTSDSSTEDKPSSRIQLSNLIRVLMGMMEPSKNTPIGDIPFFDETLNASQRDAVKFALESPEVACIHGPPGTGKTHTLIEIIRQLTTASQYNPKSLRLLVCGASNLSVDNILERLLALPSSKNQEKLKVTRIGHPARVMAREEILHATLDVKAGRSEQASLAKDVKTELETALDVLSGKGKGAKAKAPRGLERKKMWEEVKALRKEYRQREAGVVESVLGESQVVLATCHSAGGRQLRNHEFDVLIIDEATQALEAVCWIPILKAKKLILAGDPMQLPPTILSNNKRDKEKKSTISKALPAPKVKTQVKSPAEAEPPSPPEKEAEVQSEASSSSESSAEDSEDESEDKQEILVQEDASKEIQDNSARDDRSDHKQEDAAHEKKQRPIMKPKKPSKNRMLRPPRTLETTLFERLEKMYGPGIKRMLNVQYRMHEQIASFPSKMMYHSKLTSHPSVAAHLLRDLPNISADSSGDSEDLETPVVFFDTAGCEYYERLENDGVADEGSRCNENEATVVKMWVETLVNAGVLPTQIAIITPYQAQVTLLTSLLRPFYGTDLEIGTVDGMQGREKDAVIISLVRSNDKREVGFLKDKRRLNVAMTRAKRHLCVVGDSSTVQHGGPFLKKWMAWLEANADVRYAGPD